MTELKLIMQTNTIMLNTPSITKECSWIFGEGLWTISSWFL